MTSVSPVEINIRAEWETPLSEALASALAELDEKLGDDKPKNLAKGSTSIPFLEQTGTSKRYAVLTVARRDALAKWKLIVDYGASEYPETMQRAAAKVSGWDWLCEFTAAHWGKQPVIDHWISFALDNDEWRCRTLPSSVEETCEDAPALDIGPAKVDAIGYSFTSGASGLSRVDLRHFNDFTFVHGIARSLLDLGVTSHWIPFADTACKTIIAALFEPLG